MVHDVIVVGGGPAGSTCARFLSRGGASVAIVDRAVFPRVKLCAGWLSTPIWDALGLSPGEYSGGLWEWRTCHVRYGGEDRAIPCRGWFIRRFEFDEFLLQRAGADLHLGVSIRDIARDADGLWSVAGLRARHLVGAAGTNCPVARHCAPPRPSGAVGVQEHEFRADAAAIAQTRIGGDGEPELVLHDDLRGYSWNVPKTDWLNVGAGTVDPTEVRDAWQQARAHFLTAGHVPAEAAPQLEAKAMKGHSYFLYDDAHIDAAARMDSGGKSGAYLCGDSLGLSQPLTAEGILPAVVSGRVLAEAILASDPASYPMRLRAHPIIEDYQRIFRLREAALSLLRRAEGGSSSDVSATGPASRLRRLAVARGFAWMFSGAPLPARRLVDLGLGVAETLLGARRSNARSS
jgi:flavin-dependent dehydrogenase